MLLSHIVIKNLLSFGPEGIALPLRPLNVLVGPNGSGKSNLFEAISLLRGSTVAETPNSLNTFRDILRKGGGTGEWIWKGSPDSEAEVAAVVVDGGVGWYRHRIRFAARQQTAVLVDEIVTHCLENEDRPEEPTEDFEYRLRPNPRLIDRNRTGHRLETVQTGDPILSQILNIPRPARLSRLAKQYQGIHFFREWCFGRSSIFRLPQQTDARRETLAEDLSNLGLFLNHLRGNPKAKKEIVARLRDLYAGLDDFDVRVEGGTVQVFLTEGDFTIPASRLSDGTLRYLCLLAILCDPEPPPLICIEEPELGLHPDLLPKIADLLVEASERTQLIVTTHSDILIDALSEQPESVVVFEKHEGQTQAKRLDKDELKVWLEKYKLGQLWTSGHIGGTRW